MNVTNFKSSTFRHETSTTKCRECAEVFDFINQRELVFVIEQNRDGQMRTLLISEGDLAPERLVSITSYDGLPVASRFLVQALESALAERGVSVPPAEAGQGETP